MGLKSPWGEKLNKEMPLPEYPRMQLQRGNYTCLNGVWDYQINNGETPSAAYWQRIVVPFAVGSQLSGVPTVLAANECLWYRTVFTYELTNERVMLNFEAVDQCCTVYLNGIEVGSHEGGYNPFSFDVSSYIKVRNELIVRCIDQSDQGKWAWGKQRLKHGGMWYTPTAGIWQSVWLENLPDHAVRDLKITPDYDHSCVHLSMMGEFTQAVITVFEGKRLVHRGITSTKTYTIPLNMFRAWCVEDPFLYDLYIETEDDAIRSYFGMRKFSMKRDTSGYLRIALNNKPLYLSGILDQGYSVDGMLTYPSDDAMLYELRKIKNMGFNMIRKHAKQECRRWYYLCDKLGILVMQDMPNGGGPYPNDRLLILPTLGIRHFKDSEYHHFGREDEDGRKNYIIELEDMLNTLYNAVCIFAWCPFNEGWGQFDSASITERIKAYDSTRLVDSASGWHDQGAGDFNSRHCYFRPFHAKKPDGRLLFLSEFGGYSYLEKGHGMTNKPYGYKKFTDRNAWNSAVLEMFERDVLSNIPKGLSGSVFTQLSDVEDECNGIFTADRRIVKLDEKRIRRINEKCMRSIR